MIAEGIFWSMSLGAGVLIFWWLISGLKRGAMKPLHWGLPAARREDYPLLFWLYAALNMIVLTVLVASMASMWRDGTL